MQLTSAGWSVAIFAAREAPDTLRRCIRATVAACAAQRAAIDVLVNGNPALAAAVAGEVRDGAAPVRVWSIALGDKAHAWNEYLHRLWPGDRPALFIDGYADVSSQALRGLHHRLGQPNGPAQAAGRRALPRLDEPVLKTGGVHANLHAIDAATMAEMRRAGFRLPLGLYRTDSLIGAVLGFGLDPANHDWERPPLAPHAQRGVRARARPRIGLAPLAGDGGPAARQAAAAEPALPRATRRLIHDWLVEHPKQAQPVFFKRPLSLRAARKLKAQHDWTALWTPPELVSPALRH